MIEDMEPMAIDLMWLRPGKVGGTESYIRNLLDGFLQLEDDYRFVLLVSKDNIDTFRKYEEDERFSLLEAPIGSANIAKRILWQNAHQSRFLRKHGLKKCFIPVYCKPWLNGGVEYTCVIHDLMMMHYPKNHPLHEVAYSKLCWWMDVKNAHKIMATTEFVKDDIAKRYGRNDVEVINIPILLKPEEKADFNELASRYGVDDYGYYYSVAQLVPHKNVKTLVGLMNQLVKNEKYADIGIPKKLIITGVNGNAAAELRKQIEELNLQDNIIFSGFISNAERNTLYEHAHSFLFPSVFEGFGMPPLEAMYLGTPVVTTKCASIPEVTQNKATYVDGPYDVDEWIQKIKSVTRDFERPDFAKYDSKMLSKKNLESLTK